MNEFYSKNPATCRVRCNATTDSRAFVAACEAFSSERNPVFRPSIRVHQPPGGVSTIEFGQYVAPAETEALLKSRPMDLAKDVLVVKTMHSQASSSPSQRQQTLIPSVVPQWSKKIISKPDRSAI